MSVPQPAEEVKLVVSIFAGDDVLLAETLHGLAKRYGDTDFVSAPLAFGYTDYYGKEFGGSLIRRFASFTRLIRPESLPDVKNETNALEMSLTETGQRRVNIDPGYIAKAHLILATGKGYSHRPYLRDGIYADLTLIYQDKAYQALPWTYPDYAGVQMQGMLLRIRERYLLQLREIKRALKEETV